MWGGHSCPPLLIVPQVTTNRERQYFRGRGKTFLPRLFMRLHTAPQVAITLSGAALSHNANPSDPQTILSSRPKTERQRRRSGGPAFSFAPPVITRCLELAPNREEYGSCRHIENVSRLQPVGQDFHFLG